METTKPLCPYCGQSARVIKAGTNHTGSKRMRCEGCKRYFTPNKKPMGYDPALKAQAVQMCLEGMSFRAVGRALSVNC
jgi:transposase-like protein